MKYGAVPLDKIPNQDYRRVMLVAERWQRAMWAHQRWAEPAALSVDFMESRQYAEDIRGMLRRGRRVGLTLNKINPIIRLMLGYQRSNKTDIKFEPGNDALASEDTADVLSQLEKQVAKMNHQDYVDAAVFMDGLICGRGWYKTTLDFEKNDLGEIKRESADPFEIFVDPDCNTYDINDSASHVFESKFISIDEVTHGFGRKVSELVRPFVNGQTPLSPITTAVIDGVTTPVRFFGQREGGYTDWWDNFYSNMGDFVDTMRKSIRICQMEHYVSEERNVFIDLETGDRKVLPKDWPMEKIQKVLLYAQSVGNPVMIQKRNMRVPYVTTTIGDMIVHDKESKYTRFTLDGYFPYFRRGVTRGVVEDLIDPQREVNKRRSVEVEMISKAANGGWMIHEGAMRPHEEAKLERYGSSPGYKMKWRGTVKPEQIVPQVSPANHERLEKSANDDIRQISGVNESALGEVPNSSASGKALEARQRQAVISIQLYMDNLKFSKLKLGEMDLGIFQNHYTEARIFRILGEDGKFSTLEINRRVMEEVAPQQPGVVGSSIVKRMLNDITLGKYAVSIDETPLSASFQGAQYEEMMALLEKIAPSLGGNLAAFADLIINASSLPRKNEWVERWQQVVGAPLGVQAIPAFPGQPGMVPGQPMGAPGVPQIGAPAGVPGAPPPQAAPQQPAAVAG